MNLLLTAYEVVQCVILLGEYFKNFWTWVDLSRFIFMNILIIFTWTDCSWEYYEIRGLVSILVFFRGITYFGLFEPTRYMVDLLNEVIADMLGFLFILAYSVCSFSIIFYAIYNPVTDGGDSNPNIGNNTAPDQGILQSVFISYLVMLGNNFSYAPSLYTIVFIFSTIINPIILLNLVISIMGDTFNRVEQSREISNYKELAGMVLEAEQLLYWVKSDDLCYLQSCKSTPDSVIPDPVLSKFKKASLRMTSIEENLQNLDTKVTDAVEKIQEILDLTKSKASKIE